MTNTLTAGDYLEHMRVSIADIRQMLEGLDQATFQNDRVTQLAATKAIEIIGEAARSLMRHYPEFVGAHGAIPWRDIVSQRNRLIHGYFDINYDVVWEVTQRDIPELADALAALPHVD